MLNIAARQLSLPPPLSLSLVLCPASIQLKEAAECKRDVEWGWGSGGE